MPLRPVIYVCVCFGLLLAVFLFTTLSFDVRAGWSADSSISALPHQSEIIKPSDESKIMSIKLDKIGPRGGRGGFVRDVQVPPYRLLRLVIHSEGAEPGDPYFEANGAIKGISFSYTGSDGSVHHESWGGFSDSVYFPSSFEEHPIQLGLTDYVKEISGTTGTYAPGYRNIVLSLKVVTFKRTYGPYGAATDGAGRPFSFPVQGSARITGFFGRSGECLDSIGVYIREC